MATALGCIFGRVAQDVVLILIAGDLLHAAQQVVGIVDHEPAGAVGQHIKRAVVDIRAHGKWRNDVARVIEGVPVVHGWVDRTRSGATSPAGRARRTDRTAASRTGRARSTCASAARTARAATRRSARAATRRSARARACDGLCYTFLVVAWRSAY